MRLSTFRFLLAGLALLPAGAQTADDFFSGEALHQIRFEMNAADWSRLKANFAENTYYPANMTWRNQTVENAGIRSRGRGSRSGEKPGLRVDFDRYELTQEFLGLKSFVMDNLTQDASMLKERVTMLLFQRMGLPAPREAHTRLYVNGEYAGAYAIVESIDKNFLSRHLRENDGYLYEYDWREVYFFTYKGSDPAAYSPAPFRPETHETRPEPRPIEAMIRTMNQASDGDFQRAMGEYLDLRLFLTHLAAEVFLAEWDGILGAFGLNNFYFYRFERKNLSQFIVWDKDNAFGGQLVGERTKTEYPIFQNFNTNVLSRRMLTYPELRTHYLEQIQRAASLAGGPGGWLEQEIDREYNQIRTAALEDSRKRCPDASGVHVPCTNEQFEAEVAFLKRFARQRGGFVLREVASAGLVSPDGPRLASGGAVNAATFTAGPLAAGSLISVFGERLADTTAAATSLPLPTELAGVVIRINGIPAPLLFVSPGQVNLQVPWETAEGRVFLQASRNGVPGNVETATVGPVSPGVFAVVHHPDGERVSAQRPAGAGDVLVLYVNGLGAVRGVPPISGQPAPASPLLETVETPRVTIGGAPAEILFSGLTPGFVGLYQINSRMAAVGPTGASAPLVVSVGGQGSPAVMIPTR